MKKVTLNSEFDREPVKVMEGRGDVVEGGSSGDDTGSRVLDQWELMEGLERELQ